MNTIKRFVITASEFGGIKKVLFLLSAAFLFALPFMTKNTVAFTEVRGCFAAFSWIILSMLFVTVFDFRKSLKRVFGSLFCFFGFFYLFAYSWFLSLYPLDFAGLGNAESAVVVVGGTIVISLIHTSMMSVCVLIGYIAAKQTRNVYLRAVLVSFGYVLGEFVQSLGTFAMPWVRLFVGQTEHTALLQSASLFGSYFITFIMVLVNALLAQALLDMNGERRRARNCFCVALAVFCLNLGFGLVRINTVNYTDCKKLDAVVLQGNIPSSEKWTGKVSDGEVYRALADTAAEDTAYTQSPDIAVMPETAFPTVLKHDDGRMTMAKVDSVYIANRLDAEVMVGAFCKDGDNEYNSLFVVDKEGNVSKPYNKQHLVPFGEFMPYRKVLSAIVPSLAEINMLSSDLSKGTDYRPLETKAGKAACLICFDSIFSDTARKQVKNGADYIVVSTNDSWYKTSDALYQHADHSIMRAIENNRPVIRSANTGVSKIIDSKGNVLAETEVDTRTYIRETVSMPKDKTLYNHVGDVPVYIGALLIVIALVYGLIKNRKSACKK